MPKKMTKKGKHMELGLAIILKAYYVSIKYLQIACKNSKRISNYLG